METIVSMPTTLRYCGFTHYKNTDPDEDNITPIQSWLKERFEVFCVYSVENAGSGPHIQWYGETKRPWSKSDTNVHGVRGLLGKHIPSAMRVSKAKRWSKQVAKKDRDRNCEYVAKGGIVSYMSDGDPEDFVGRWKECSRKKSETFHELLLRLWNDNGRPSCHKEIYLMLVKSRAMSWNNFAPNLLWKAADWLVNQSDMDESVNMYDQMYEEQRRRMIGN